MGIINYARLTDKAILHSLMHHQQRTFFYYGKKTREKAI